MQAVSSRREAGHRGFPDAAMVSLSSLRARSSSPLRYAFRRVCIFFQVLVLRQLSGPVVSLLSTFSPCELRFDPALRQQIRRNTRQALQ